MATAFASSAILFLILAPLLSATAAQERVAESLAEGSATAAHWLITRDGQRIETRGAWKVEGRRVLYTDTRGVLASLRLSSIDVEASEIASRPRPQTVIEPVGDPAARGPVLVLSNRDVAAWNGVMPSISSRDGGEEGAVTTPASRGSTSGSTASTSTSATAVGAGATTEPAAAPSAARGPQREGAESSRLSVVSYRDLGDYEQGIQLFGTVRNDSEDEARNVRVTVRVLDEGGNQLGEKAAQIRNRRLGGGETLTFRVSFPDLRAYGSVEFDLTAEG